MKNLIQYLALDTKPIIKKGDKVYNTLTGELEVYGFVVPTVTNKKEDFLPSAVSVIVGGNIMFYDCNGCYIRGFVYPVVQAVKEDEEISFKRLYMPEMKMLNKSSEITKYDEWYIKGKSHMLETLPKVEKRGVDYYVVLASQGDYHFKSNSDLHALYKRFSVICRRINKITGEISCEIYDPEDLYYLPYKDNEIENPFAVEDDAKS